jgi:hypothetical protein
VKPEKKLYHLFKKNCPDLLITPLEVWNNLGVPDLLLYNKNVGFFMVELKIQNGNKIKFSPHQILFHTLRTKRNYILGSSDPRPSFLHKTLWIGKYKRLIGKP